jgi:hypothetical protein
MSHVQRALDDVVRRHESLNASFATDVASGVRDTAMRLSLFRRTYLFVPGLFRMSVRDSCPVNVREWQIESASDQRLLAAIARLVTEAVTSAEPHWPRAAVLRVRDGSSFLIVVLSHVVVDGWSVRLFQQEFVAFYDACVKQQPTPSLPNAPKYSDFALSQHEDVVVGRMRSHIDYWLGQWGQLGDAAIRHRDLPFQRFVAGPPQIRMAMRRATDAESALIRAAARSLGTTPYVLFRTALAIVLHQFTGKRRLAFWANFANRGSAPDLIGWCANSHQLTASLSPEQSWGSICSQIADELAESRRHEALPLPALWRHTGVNLAAGGSTRINFDVWPVTRSPSTAMAEPMLVLCGRRWMDLDVRFRDDDGCFSLFATYNANRYVDRGVSAVLAHMHRVVVAGVAAPSTAVARLIETRDPVRCGEDEASTLTGDCHATFSPKFLVSRQ